MKLIMTKFMNVAVVTAALLLNVACSSSNSSANVWSNSDYGTGAVSGSHYSKNASGMALMN